MKRIKTHMKLRLGIFLFILFVPVFVYAQTLDEKLKDIDAYAQKVMDQDYRGSRWVAKLLIVNAGAVYIYKARPVRMRHQRPAVVPTDRPRPRKELYRHRRPGGTCDHQCQISLSHQLVSCWILYQHNLWADRVFLRVKKADGNQVSIGAHHVLF